MIMRQNHFLICGTLAPRQGLTRGTVADVVCRIISKVAAREGAILSFVVHRNMWGDALLLDQPVRYRSRPAGGIGREPVRLQTEAL